MKRISRLMTLLAIVAMIAVACGDSGDDGEEQSATTTTAAATTTVAAEPDDTSAADETPATLDTLIEDVPGLDDDCVAIVNVFATLANASLALTGQGGLDDGDAQALFDEAASQLPGDLQDDVQVMADAMGQYFQALDEIGFDFNDPDAIPTEEQFAALLELGDALDTPEFNAASLALSEYAEAQCPDFEG